MDNSFTNNPFLTDQQDNENSPANSGDSPRSAGFNDTKSTSVSSPKRSRRDMQKRVVSVPIRDVEGSRLKGETSAPPSDSWAWRKYGQKPIKGSPYPRGYYRCSSSKGCPARKQVERSRVDPNMLVVTYSCEHNHPWPPSRNNNHRTNQSPTPAATTASAAAAVSDSDHEKSEVFGNPLEDDKAEEKFGNLGEESLITVDQFGWFPEAESAISTMLESPILAAEESVRDADSDAAMLFSAREEEDSLFADLGELPEFSLVFRLGAVERAEEERRRCGLRPCCGTTG